MTYPKGYTPPQKKPDRLWIIKLRELYGETHLTILEKKIIIIRHSTGWYERKKLKDDKKWEWIQKIKSKQYTIFKEITHNQPF